MTDRPGTFVTPNFPGNAGPMNQRRTQRLRRVSSGCASCAPREHDARSISHPGAAVPDQREPLLGKPHDHAARGGKPFTSTYVTPEARAYKAKVEEIVKAMGIRKPIGGRVRVDLRLYPHRPQDWQARQRKFGAAWDDSVQCLDLDNARKVAYDALRGWSWKTTSARSETGDRMEPTPKARAWR